MADETRIQYWSAVVVHDVGDPGTRHRLLLVRVEGMMASWHLTGVRHANVLRCAALDRRPSGPTTDKNHANHENQATEESARTKHSRWISPEYLV